MLTLGRYGMSRADLPAGHLDVLRVGLQLRDKAYQQRGAAPAR